jgi:hypothetical protein
MILAHFTSPYSMPYYIIGGAMRPPHKSAATRPAAAVRIPAMAVRIPGIVYHHDSLVFWALRFEVMDGSI